MKCVVIYCIRCSGVASYQPVSLTMAAKLVF
jgi:hypothetical protein